MLRITAASIVSGLLLCSPSFSQTVDISSLTETEQSVHRASHCYALQRSLGFDYPRDWADPIIKIEAINKLLGASGFLKSHMIVDNNDVASSGVGNTKR